MKRLILLPLVLLTTMMLRAQVIDTPDFSIKCKDGSVAYYHGYMTEMTFNEDGTVLYITTEGMNSLVSYAVEGIEAIEFAESYVGKYSYDGSHVNVDFDPTDDTSYTEAKEQVITDKDHDDYGDFIENYTPSNRITITYDGESATVTGKVSGVTVMPNGAHVIVLSTKKNVAYTLKGTTGNGSFKLYSDYKTLVTLDGVDITNPTGAAINIQSGKTIMVDLADGSINKLTDGASYTMASGEDQKGTFFSEGQLVFSGSTGSLEVKSLGGHGIVSDDYIRVRGGNIAVESVRDGINTNDCFIMYGGSVTVDAAEDGVDIGKGYIEIGAGRLMVNAVDEGVTASYEGDDNGTIDPTVTPYVLIKGGLVKVNTTGEKGHALRAMSTFTMSGGIVQVTVKGAGSKALMSEKTMTLSGGKITALTEGDASYDAELDELSSAAAIRSKGTLTIEDMIVGLKSLGNGGKGINNVGDVILKNSQVTAVVLGGDYEYGSLKSYSRGVTTDAALTIDGATLKVRTHEIPLLTGGAPKFVNGAVYTAYQIGK